MQRPSDQRLATAALVLVLSALGALLAAETRAAPQAKQPEAQPSSDDAAPTAPAERRQYTTETVKGRVVWLAEGLKRLYGVATEVAAAENSTALETPDGHLLPILPDTRGQAFSVDAELRNVDVELLVRRYEGVPMIQVIRLREPKPEGLMDVDYWCEVCAIPMYILKPCECCQGPTQLRYRKVEE